MTLELRALYLQGQSSFRSTPLCPGGWSPARRRAPRTGYSIAPFAPADWKLGPSDWDETRSPACLARELIVSQGHPALDTLTEPSRSGMSDSSGMSAVFSRSPQSEQPSP